MSEHTPETLLHEPIHAPTCRRYIEGMQNTMARECTCFLAKYVAAWEADIAAAAWAADIAEVLERRLAHELARLREAVCECLPRPDSMDVQPDNDPQHHDFSCPYRTGAPGGLLDAARAAQYGLHTTVQQARDFKAAVDAIRQALEEEE